MSVITKDLGAVTAYAAAVNRGYTGTKEEFETLMASYATVAEQAAESAQSASSSAQGAFQAATSANTAMNNARTAESNAQSAESGAQGYAQFAQQSAQSASRSATDAESAKQTAVDAVDGFVAGAQQALDDVNQAGNYWKSLAQAQKLDSEAWAVGQRDREDVGVSDPAYHNNAKYYAEQTAASSQQIIDDAAAEKAAAQIARQGAEAAASNASASAAAAEDAAGRAEEAARTLTIDNTLTQEGQAADAKVVGDEIDELKSAIDNMDFAPVTEQFIISDAFPNSSGVITVSTLWDCFCEKVAPRSTIGRIEVSADSQQLLFSFYESKPEIDSVSYNNSRSGMGAGVLVGKNIVVPDGCNWIAIRIAKNSMVYFDDDDWSSARTSTQFPIYIGDWIIPYDTQHGCCLSFGQRFMCFVSDATGSSNIGSGYIFDLVNNRLLSIHDDIAIGHANSCAKDTVNSIVYIAPIYDYDNNTLAYYLYKYSYSLEYLGKEEIPFVANGVSYDDVLKRLWAYSNSGQLYYKKDDEWILFDTLDFSPYQQNVYGRRYDQDFAIHGDTIVFSSSRRSLLIGTIRDKVSISRCISIPPVDSTMTFLLGELEGIEFHSSGNLFAADYVRLSTSAKNMFVIEIPIGITPNQFPNVGGALWENNDSFTLSRVTQSKFCLAKNEIRSLAQLIARYDKYSVVSIASLSGYTYLADDYAIRINRDITVRVNTNYICDQFDLRGGKLVLHNRNGSNIITFNNRDAGIKMMAGTSLEITGVDGLTFESMESTIDAPDNNMITFDIVPVNTKVNGIAIENPGMYRGEKLLMAFENT